MGKNKLSKFAEIKAFDHVIEPPMDTFLKIDHELKGQWHQKVFGNNNDIVLELGCGKGEYAVNLGRKDPDKNFVGIDIKGARLWRGAKITADEKLTNIRFLRTRIEFLDHFFCENEVAEIWITFPDPQRKKRQRKKRLTHTSFLKMYQHILKPGGIVHLKTDSLFLHKYTKEIIAENELTILTETANLYQSEHYKNELMIKTHYEALFLEGNPTITYLKFQIGNQTELKEPDADDDAFL